MAQGSADIRYEGWSLASFRRATGPGEERHLTHPEHSLGVSDQLQRLRSRCENLESLRRLANRLAHDYRNLLMGIEGCAERALEHSHDCAVARREGGCPVQPYLEEIQTAASQGYVLANRLLHCGGGVPSAPKVTLELDKTVADARCMLDSLVGRETTLHLSLDAPGAKIEVPEGWLEQALFNLALNARDALDERGDGAVWVETCYREPGRVELEIRDNGPGIPAALQERVFEQGFTTKRAQSGAGLGLSAVRDVVERLGGEVSVTSIPGEGASFRFGLPCLTAGKAPQPEQDSPAAKRKASLRVLVVEDEPLVLLSLGHFLRRAGHRPALAHDGSEAREELRLAPDVLLCDVTLPETQLDRLVSDVLRRAPQAKVIYMSATPQDELIALGDVPPDAITLEKPFSAETLLETLEEVCR